MASTWGGSWGGSWLDSWSRGVVAPPVVTPVSGGGGYYAYQRYRDEKEIRQERIALGIIPPDEPESSIVIEASKQFTPALAKRKLRQLAEGHARLAELDRLLGEIIQAQQIADEFAYQDMLMQLGRANRELQTINNQTAIFVMLGLL